MWSVPLRQGRGRQGDGRREQRVDGVSNILTVRLDAEVTGFLFILVFYNISYI